MADLPAEEITQLEQIIATLRRRLGALELQRARLGEHTPPHIILEIEDIKRELVQRWASLRRLRPGPTDASAPYLGLLTFHEQDADRFFGREALVAELVERAGSAPFLAVLGPSGSGKSSVVRAGLIPMLKGGALPGSERWRYLTFKPGARPLDMLATELTKLQGGDISSVLVLSRQLAETERALLLAAGLLLDRAAGQLLVLVVDQAEELWTLAPAEPDARAAFVKEQQRPFIEQLLAASAAPDTPLLIVLTVRADFLHRAAEHPALARAIGDHDLIVSPMTPAELREAIERPADLAGAGFEPGLVDELIAQTAGREGALPLLEYTLLELWKADHGGGMLTWATYRAIGGVDGALAQTADSILASRYTDEQRDELRAILLRLVQPGEGAADTRRRAALADLAPADGSADAVQALLAPLVEARLLVVTTTDDRRPTTDETTAVPDTVQPSSIVHRPSSAQVEVAHEALIRAWPALRSWVDAARADLRFQIQFEEDAQEWERSRKSEDFLWGGLRLANAEAWIARSHPRLNARCQAFLEASRAQEQARSAAKAAAARRLRRLAIALAAVAAVAVLLAIAAGVFGVQSQQSAADARAQATLAIARQLVAQAAADTETQPDRALLFSIEATGLTSEARAKGNLLHELLSVDHFEGRLRGHTNVVLSVAFSPDGTTLASASGDGTIRLWDVKSRLPLGDPLTSHTNVVWSVAFSPDGTTLASASDDTTIRLWDVKSHQPLGNPLTGHTAAVRSVAFSPDGTTLASASDDTTIRLWDVKSRQPLGATLIGHTDVVLSVAFSPDGATLASASGDATIRLWDVKNRQLLGAALTGHTGGVYSVAFSPDGVTLVSASLDQSIRLWDVKSRLPLGDPLTSHTAAVRSVAFSPDGTTLASASDNGTIQLWNVMTHQPLGDPLTGHITVVRSVVFSPDGTTLASASDDKTIRLWDVKGHQPLSTLLSAPLTNYTGAVASVAFSPDGSTLASTGDDKTIRLWDVKSGQPLRDPLTGLTERVQSVAFSPDGSILASAGDDSTIRLWDVKSRLPLGDPLTGHTRVVWCVAFSPDGSTLASASLDQTIRLWDVKSHLQLGAALIGHDDWVYSVAFSPDGSTLASTSADQTIRLWDVKRHLTLGTALTGHTGAVYSVAFSPDGTTLASASSDQTIRLWNVKTHQPLGDPLTGHTNAVVSVAFSPDGRTLASASVDHNIRLWDVTTHQPLGDPLAGHISSVEKVAFSRDGTTLASSSLDQSIRLWDVTLEGWKSSACQIAGRNLTKQEWDDFIGADRPYHRTCPAFPPGEGEPADAP